MLLRRVFRTLNTDPSRTEADADPRAALLRRLLLAIRARAGLEPTRATADKLMTRFRGTDMLALAALADRLDSLPTRAAEWLDLIGAVTVHETMFMRDLPQFALFADRVLRELIASAKAGDRSLRIGSAGCSTGEEAYSIAMLVIEALAEAGEVGERVGEGPGNLVWTQPWRILITGCDIAPAVLVQARRAVYDAGAFSSLRGLPGRFLRFLPREPKNPVSHRVRADLRELVSFQSCNLVESTPPGGPFDALFCRNVLFYLSAEARQAAQGALQRAVRPGGWLLLGATDRLREPTDFDPVWGEGAVAYVRRAGA